MQWLASTPCVPLLHPSCKWFSFLQCWSIWYCISYLRIMTACSPYNSWGFQSAHSNRFYVFGMFWNFQLLWVGILKCWILTSFVGLLWQATCHWFGQFTCPVKLVARGCSSRARVPGRSFSSPACHPCVYCSTSNQVTFLFWFSLVDLLVWTYLRHSFF
jgi:hypothetical protein